MKNYSNTIYILLLLVFVLQACEQNEIMTFDTERSGVNFESYDTEYAFSYSQKSIDTLDIPFNINGMAMDYVRNANFSVLTDSTDALDTEYKIISAEVAADELKGNLKIMVTKNDLDSIPDRRIWLQTDVSDDFEPGIYYMSNHILILTDRFVPPVGWYPGSYKTRYLLGEYSTSYYKWIISATGETQFPYPRAIPGYNNDEKWDYSYKKIWVMRLKDLLKAYNASIAPDVLIHSDGQLEGEPVVVGVYKR